MATCNVGTMMGKYREIVETLKKRRVNIAYEHQTLEEDINKFTLQRIRKADPE